MPRPSAAVVAELNEASQRIEELMEARDYQGAQRNAEDLAARARKAGVRSAHLTWLLAIVADHLEQSLAAFTLIQEALSMDPLAPPFIRSERIICRRMREALCNPAREATDPETPRIWEALVRAGAADDACHLALARHHLAKGNALQALRVVDAVTTLSPTFGDAWVLKVAIATELGDKHLATTAEAEATALGVGLTAFGPVVAAAG